MFQLGDGGSIPTHSLKKSDWIVKNCTLKTAQEMVGRLHYSRGGSNTAVYTLGVFNKNSSKPVAVSWWLPPTKHCGMNVWPTNPQAVLALSRLVCEPEAPKNTPSFLLGHGMRLIDRKRWPVLITFADRWQGHKGTIYKASGWIYCGETRPQETYVRDGRMICRKATKTRTHQEMLDLGCSFLGKFKRIRFVHIRPDLKEIFEPIRERLVGDSDGYDF